MLGKSISDPHGVDSSVQKVDGLNFVNVQTEFSKTKRTLQVTGNTLVDAMGCEGDSIFGYEVHMGRTLRAPGVQSFCKISGALQSEDGAVSPDGLVVGTYVHGIFDAPGLFAW